MANKPLHSKGRKAGANAAKGAGTKPAPGPAGEQAKAAAQELRKQVHRLEVEIAAAPRIAKEKYLRNYNMVPPPETTRPKKSAVAAKTHAQKEAEKRRQMMLFAEFMVSLIIVLGIGAWAYKAWLMFSASR